MAQVALVIYDTRYGNTFRIAEALTRGLQTVSGVIASCRNQAEVHDDLLQDADLLVIGGPTEYFSASPHIREFFNRIGGFELKGKFGFAFDTHAPSPLSGHASRLIEKDLKRMGVTLLEPRHSAITQSTRGTAAGNVHVELAPDAVAEFEKIGHQLGQELLEAIAKRPKPPEYRADLT
ncbi:MAG TPA: flavodoxin domain-containing protein [Thermoplasmata archaeon]|nr:flavodoxin domain-containing protein [Thermoplasmata archaeon]